MKNIPPNIWRTSLDDDDWNFLQVQNDEWPQCLRWELRREKSQAEAGGQFPSEKIRVPAPGENYRIMRARIAMGKPAGILIKPDWTSYLSRRKKERWKPLPKHEYDQTSWIDLDWNALYRHWGDQVEYAGTHLPFSPIMDGDGETEIVPLKIPWGWRDEEIIAAFAQWLKKNRPQGEKGDERPRIDEPPKPKNKSGAGSRIRQVKKVLKALAAWRLIQHYRGDDFSAIHHPGAIKYLGKAFGHPSEWTDARKTVQEALKSISLLSK